MEELFNSPNNIQRCYATLESQLGISKKPPELKAKVKLVLIEKMKFAYSKFAKYKTDQITVPEFVDRLNKKSVQYAFEYVMELQKPKSATSQPLNSSYPMNPTHDRNRYIGPNQASLKSNNQSSRSNNKQNTDGMLVNMSAGTAGYAAPLSDNIANGKGQYFYDASGQIVTKINDNNNDMFADEDLNNKYQQQLQYYKPDAIPNAMPQQLLPHNNPTIRKAETSIMDKLKSMSPDKRKYIIDMLDNKPTSQQTQQQSQLTPTFNPNHPNTDFAASLSGTKPLAPQIPEPLDAGIGNSMGANFDNNSANSGNNNSNDGQKLQTQPDPEEDYAKVLERTMKDREMFDSQHFEKNTSSTTITPLIPNQTSLDKANLGTFLDTLKPSPFQPGKNEQIVKKVKSNESKNSSENNKNNKQSNKESSDKKNTNKKTNNTRDNNKRKNKEKSRNSEETNQGISFEELELLLQLIAMNNEISDEKKSKKKKKSSTTSTSISKETNKTDVPRHKKTKESKLNKSAEKDENKKKNKTKEVKTKHKSDDMKRPKNKSSKSKTIPITTPTSEPKSYLPNDINISTPTPTSTSAIQEVFNTPLSSLNNDEKITRIIEYPVTNYHINVNTLIEPELQTPALTSTLIASQTETLRSTTTIPSTVIASDIIFTEEVLNEINNSYSDQITCTDLVINSEQHAMPNHYNDYLVVLPEPITNVNKIEITKINVPLVKHNIDTHNNSLKLTIADVQHKITIANGLYNVDILINTINETLTNQGINSQVLKTQEGYIMIKNSEIFELNSNETGSILRTLGFTRSCYKNRNNYLSNKKCKLSTNNIVYLYLPDIFFKENIATIDLTTGSYVQHKKLINLDILKTIYVKFKTNEDFDKENLYDFKGAANSLEFKIFTN
jgi:hypothetical protein